jgi:hypothetical protein
MSAFGRALLSAFEMTLLGALFELRSAFEKVKQSALLNGKTFWMPKCA